MSFVDAIRPIFKYIPEVEAPEQRPVLSTRLKYTFFVLVIFFILGSIRVFGMDAAAASQLSAIEVLLASSIGTLLTVGIGPIVVASIILQLLVGTKLLNLDFSNHSDRAAFSSMQKILAVILSVFEAWIYVNVGFLAPSPGMFGWVVLQVALGSIILMYLDEVVQKYGVGSGIGLFIAGGVASSIFWRIFSPLSKIGSGMQLVSSGAYLDLGNAVGLLWSFFNELGTSLITSLINNILPIAFALVIFFIVIYFEGVFVNIPITMGRNLGRFPVKFLYVSNIPVIMAVALFANITLLYSLVEKKSIPFITSALFYLSTYTQAPRSIVKEVLLSGFAGQWGNILHAAVYMVLLILTCIVFGVLWVKMAGQDSEAVSNQLQKSGMFLPGFRRDPRVIRGVLDRYIPTITILGSVFVAVLAGFASITDAVGTGMGILLTVSIVYRLYEDIAKEQVATDTSLLSKVFKAKM